MRIVLFLKKGGCLRIMISDFAMGEHVMPLMINCLFFDFCLIFVTRLNMI